ncbi:MAG: hypothetical protein IH944_09840 [Armatimonadetes bacterium]|nr:hypothetical protein [Armatimonadota bacterium]
MEIWTKHNFERKKKEQEEREERERAKLTSRARAAYDEIRNNRREAVRAITWKSRLTILVEQFDRLGPWDRASDKFRLAVDRFLPVATKERDEVIEQTKKIKEEVIQCELKCNQVMREERIKSFSPESQEKAWALFEQLDKELADLPEPQAKPSFNDAQNEVDRIELRLKRANECEDKETAGLLTDELSKAKNVLEEMRKAMEHYQARFKDLQETCEAALTELELGAE